MPSKINWRYYCHKYNLVALEDKATYRQFEVGIRNHAYQLLVTVTVLTAGKLCVTQFKERQPTLDGRKPIPTTAGQVAPPET